MGRERLHVYYGNYNAVEFGKNIANSNILTVKGNYEIVYMTPVHSSYVPFCGIE